MFFVIKLFFFIILVSTLSCTQKTYYSGKILNKYEDFENLQNKEELVLSLGMPNYIDPIDNKFYYFSEQSSASNLLNQKVTNREMIVFTFEENKIILIAKYDLNDSNDIDFIKAKTKNNLIKRGLIQKIFGGVTSSKISGASD